MLKARKRNWTENLIPPPSRRQRVNARTAATIRRTHDLVLHQGPGGLVAVAPLARRQSADWETAQLSAQKHLSHEGSGNV
jgi:hypothetical protein